MLEVLGRMTDYLHGLLPSPWLWAVVFVISAMDGLLPFMPSDTTVIVVGVLVAADPVRLGLLILVAAAGAFAGDVLSYVIGRRSGAMLSRLTRTERGRRRHRWVLTQLRRQGTLLILLTRYVPGGRVATMLTAGALRYPTRKFLVTEGIATPVWATFLALLGAAGGASFAEQPALGLLMAFAIGIGLALLVEAGRRILMRGRTRVVRPERERLPAAEETYSAA
jgi:membrane protein DedA with SNARE-associated domain